MKPVLRLSAVGYNKCYHETIWHEKYTAFRLSVAFNCRDTFCRWPKAATFEVGYSVAICDLLVSFVTSLMTDETKAYLA